MFKRQTEGFCAGSVGAGQPQAQYESAGCPGSQAAKLHLAVHQTQQSASEKRLLSHRFQHKCHLTLSTVCF